MKLREPSDIVINEGNSQIFNKGGCLENGADFGVEI
jgi:hypothetical protein